jgi:hypothetical protein
MASLSKNVYIYLTRRDKTSVRILAKFIGQEILVQRLSNLEFLNIPISLRSEIEQKIYDDRMMWEPWVDSCNNFEEFRAALKIRGYSNIPLSEQPEITATTASAYAINTKNLIQKKTMLRKN